jgi:hypothetical protein
MSTQKTLEELVDKLEQLKSRPSDHLMIGYNRGISTAIELLTEQIELIEMTTE